MLIFDGTVISCVIVDEPWAKHALCDVAQDSTNAIASAFNEALWLASSIIQ
jgi:hypothetical protein